MGPTHSSQFMERHNSRKLKHALCAPNFLKQLPENQINTHFIYQTSLNFVTISYKNYWDQLNSWKNFWKFWIVPLCRNRSGPSSLLNVAVYWQSNNTEACAKKLYQILANNIDNCGRGIGLRIYVKYCRRQELWSKWT